MHHRTTPAAGTARAAALVLLCALAACARSAAPFGPPTVTGEIEARSYFFEQAARDMPYALYVSTRYRPDRPAPLVVALHGLGSNPGQVIRYQGLTQLAEERGYIVVAPMGYNERGWYGSLGPGRNTIGAVAGDPENLGALSEQDVLNVLAIVRRDYNIDPRRIFLFGHSMGGGGTLHLGMKYPQTWAGLAPVAPAIYSETDGLTAIRRVPVIVIHGTADRLVPVDISRRWVARMQELGMTHRYIEVQGGDHTAIIARNPEHMRQIFDFFDGAPGR
jgi:predicted peptidase